MDFRIHKAIWSILPLFRSFFAGNGKQLSVRMKGFEDKELPVGREKMKTETDVKDRLIRNSVSVYCANRVVCADKRAVRADPI